MRKTCSNSQLLRPESDPDQSVALVPLVETSKVPTRKGRFLEAQIDTTFEKGQELLFEPRMCVLKELGLSCQELLLMVQPNDKLLIPLQKYRGEQISLGQGLDLGKVECFDNAVKPESEPISDPIPTCNHVTREILCAHVTTTDSRPLSLKEQLNMPEEGRLTSD